MLRLQVGGHLAYLEPDVVAFQAGGRFHVVEIKSFAVIDGQADEESVAAAAMQAAVYVLALQDLLTAEVAARRGGRPPTSSWSRRRTSPASATATLLDVRKQVSVLRRQLARMTRIDTLLDALPPGTHLRPGARTRRQPHPAARRAGRRAGDVPARYQPRCLRDLRDGGLLPRRSPRRRLR